jgi:hypothetical protein
MGIAVALFENPDDVQKAVDQLHAAGFSSDDINIYSKKTIESTQVPKPIPSAGGAAGTGQPAGAAQPTAPGAAPGGGGGIVFVDGNINSLLASLGVNPQLIPMFTHGIKEGGRIVRVRTGLFQKGKASKILTQNNGKTGTT